MILSSKHVKLSNSMLNVGAVLLKQIDNTQTVTILWNDSKIKSKIMYFEKFILGLDFLFMLGLVDYNKGIIKKVQP